MLFRWFCATLAVLAGLAGFSVAFVGLLLLMVGAHSGLRFLIAGLVLAALSLWSLRAVGGAGSGSAGGSAAGVVAALVPAAGLLLTGVAMSIAWLGGKIVAVLRLR